MSDNRRTSGEDDRDDVALRLRLAITRTARALRQEAGGTLTPTALSALASIDRHEPLSPARLAEIEGVKRPTATRIIGHLDDAGLVERRPDAADGRSFTLELSESGRAYLAERRLRKSVYLAEMLEGLTDDEVATLARAAEILESSHRDSLESEGPSDSVRGS